MGDQKPTRRQQPPFDYSLDFDTIDFRQHPELYRIGKGEQGVLLVEPYKSELLPHWRFRTPELAAAQPTRSLPCSLLTATTAISSVWIWPASFCRWDLRAHVAMPTIGAGANGLPTGKRCCPRKSMRKRPISRHLLRGLFPRQGRPDVPADESRAFEAVLASGRAVGVIRGEMPRSGCDSSAQVITSSRASRRNEPPGSSTSSGTPVRHWSRLGCHTLTKASGGYRLSDIGGMKNDDREACDRSPIRTSRAPGTHLGVVAVDGVAV